MRTFFNRHWKMMLVGLLTIFLVIALVKIRNLENRITESFAAVEVLNKKIASNDAKVKAYEESIAELNKQIGESKTVVITKTQLYEKVKSGPLNTTISDPDLVKRLRDLRTEYKKKR